MRISKLKHRINVQSRNTTLDAYGQQINSWTSIATVWAEIKPLSGKEKTRMNDMLVESQLTHQVTVRFSTLFLPAIEADGWRILFGSRVLNIVASMNIDEDDKFLVFDCTEGSLDGQ